MKMAWYVLLKLLLMLLVVGVSAWGLMALYFQLSSGLWRIMAMLGLGVASVAALYAVARGAAWPALPLALSLLVLLAWWQTILPSNDRPWAADVDRVSYGQAQGDVVTLHNVRDFTWRSETDFDERWQTYQYDLEQLRSVDMFLSYWMGPAIAHTLVSFGFEDGRHVVFSVEIRKEKNERFSALGGFFKQFEMTLIAAQESDIIRTRSNARGEDVYMYSVSMPKPAMKALFMSYVQQGNALREHPRFYNTLTANCTTIVYDMVTRIVNGLPWDWRILASGYLPDYVFAQGALAKGHSLDELRQLGHINARALSQQEGEDYSQLIRRDVPMVKP